MEYKAASTGPEWRTPPRVCRCCLSEGCYKDISTEYYWMGEKETYAEMLRECFDLTISLQEGAGSNSRLICEVCITRLRDASNFKKQVVSSEKRFTDHIKTGAGLSSLTGTDEPMLFPEVKIEAVLKDEAVISDDDPGPEDDIYDDPDYDESDSLPLKYEVQKKEALEMSFSDEIPTLSNPEMTIRRVSTKSKEKSSKKVKLNKKELTIKPVKAGGSKVKTVKAAKAPKAAKEAKSAKPIKKGPIYEFIENSILKRNRDSKQSSSTSDKGGTVGPVYYHFNRGSSESEASRSNAKVILEYSNATPFRTGLSAIVCAYCGDLFSEPILMREHTREKHAAHNILSVFVNLNKDQMVKADLADLSCKLCSEKHNLSSLKIHLKDVHGKNIDTNAGDGIIPFTLVKDDWKCYVCANRFLCLRALNSHMSEHFQNYMCENCGKSFMLKRELLSHTKAHSDPTEPRVRPKKGGLLNYRCTKCADRFHTYDQRWRHMERTHGMEAPKYKCMECPSVFARRSARHLHMQTVHNIKNNFKCPHCTSVFVTKVKLDEHVAKHAGDRAHECPVCGKAYVQQKTLREHMKIHSNDRLVCSACGQAFVQRASFRQHVRAHHPDMPLDGLH